MIGIYKIVNTIDGKMYVGYSKNLSGRKRSHFWQLSNNRHGNEYLQHAYNKYGKDSFMFEIIEECDIKEVYAREHHWVNTLNTLDQEFGYNLKPTDPNGLSGLKSLAEREKIRKANLGKKASDETRRRLSESHKGQISWMKGRTHSEEVKRIISQKQIGVKQKQDTIDKRVKHLLIPILQYDLNGNFIREWNSARDAGIELNIKCKHISCCVLDKRYYANGFIWRKHEDNYPSKIDPIKTRNIPIQQYSLSGEFITEYKSIYKAEKFLNIDRHCISNCIKGKQQTAGGFKWKTTQDND